MSPFWAANAFLSVVVKLAIRSDELVTTTAFPAVKFKLALALISGVSVPVDINLSAVTVLVTTRSFSTVKSLLTVTAGVTVIALESLESSMLLVNVKLPRFAGCRALAARAP